jgi:hypothetical protein
MREEKRDRRRREQGGEVRRGKGLKKASETCLASFDQELGASRHQNRE